MSARTAIAAVTARSHCSAIGAIRADTTYGTRTSTATCHTWITAVATIAAAGASVAAITCRAWITAVATVTYGPRYSESRATITAKTTCATIGTITAAATSNWA